MSDVMRAREDALVNAFIVPTKRERYRTLLANRKRRGKILDALNHLRDLDPRYATPHRSTTDVVSLLREHGAPERCHVISDYGKLDGKEMSLVDAVEEAEAGMSGTLIGCIPGKLAYYYGENGEERVLLARSG